jgi:RimJ/RimL family protein N-acetyltransferase
VSPLETPVLVGRRVRLEPLRLGDVAALVRAAEEDRRAFDFTVVPRGIDAMSAQVEGLLRDYQQGLVVPFVQVDAVEDRVVGMTRFLTIRCRPGEVVPFGVEIGGTWLAESAQRSGINTEAKLLLLRHAFDEWHVTRVDLKTDSRNERSKSAIARLGATFEGVLRHWQPSQVVGEEGGYRDTAMFSIIDAEWPSVAARLATLLR